MTPQCLTGPLGEPGAGDGSETPAVTGHLAKCALLGCDRVVNQRTGRIFCCGACAIAEGLGRRPGHHTEPCNERHVVRGPAQ